MCLQHNKFKESNFKNVRSYILKLLSNYTRNSGQLKIDSYKLQNFLKMSLRVQNTSFITMLKTTHL